MTKATLIAGIATTAIAGIISLADKHIREVERDKASIKRGYEKVSISKMACDGLSMGEYCVAGTELSIGMFGDDVKEDVVSKTTTFYIIDRKDYEAELDVGFYAVNDNGKIRKAFFNGEDTIFFIAGADKVKVTSKIDLESAALAKEVKELRHQTNRATELESEIRLLKKKIESLENESPKNSKKGKESTEKTLA